MSTVIKGSLLGILIALTACEQDDDTQRHSGPSATYFDGIAEAGRPNIPNVGSPGTGFDAGRLDGTVPEA
jgi:hypothetical protein